jgi:hypothetical protein
MIDKAFLVELFILVPYDFRGALRHTIFFAPAQNPPTHLRLSLRPFPFAIPEDLHDSRIQ